MTEIRQSENVNIPCVCGWKQTDKLEPVLFDLSAQKSWEVARNVLADWFEHWSRDQNIILITSKWVDIYSCHIFFSLIKISKQIFGLWCVA